MLKQLHTKLDIKKLDEAGTFEGYGAVFANVDMDQDKIMPGAFAGTLATKPMTAIKLLWQHTPAEPIGVWEEMKEDKHGLFVKGKIIKDVQRGAEALALMKAGAVDGLSIGFRTVKSLWDHENEIRELHELDLWEISVVTFPANPSARVDAVKMTIRDAEHLLREGGMPSEFAKLVTKHGFEEAQRMVTKKVQRDVDLSEIASPLTWLK